MPIPLQTPIVEHVGNGVTTVFAYSFAILDSADLKVRVGGADITTGFTVSGVGNRAGGSVTFAVAPANGAEVLLFREVALKRDTDYQYAGDLREDVLDDDFDRLVMGLQDMFARFQRSITIPAGETFTSLPAASARANRVMGFGPDGEVVLLNSFGDGGGGSIDIVPADGSVTTQKLATGAVTAAKAAPTLVEDLLGYPPANAATVLTALNGKAALAGSSSQVFAVGAATADEHAVRRDQLGVANAPLAKAALNASGDAPIYACRAWVNFDGVGTAALRAAGNFSSVGDTGTGSYALNFVDSMSGVDYAIVGGLGRESATTGTGLYRVTAKTATGFSVVTVDAGGTAIEYNGMSFAIFR